MCEICDGKTIEELLARDAELIAEHGYIVQGVDGGDDHLSWAYTVGLVDVARHPELIVVGVRAELAMTLVDYWAQWTLDGYRFDVGEEVDFENEFIARIGAVHDVQYASDTFATWYRLQSIGAVQVSRRLEARQLVLPTSMFCSAHAQFQPLLDDPTARFEVAAQPNRAARRRRRR